jgi:hypothetical protein
VNYDPGQTQDSIHDLLKRAVSFGPISEIEEQLLTAKEPEAGFVLLACSSLLN